MRVLVLYQTINVSRADELDTEVQAQEVISHISALGYECRYSAISNNMSDIESLILLYKPDVVFNLIESFGGSDGLSYLAAGFLEALGIPFTGNSAKSLLLSSDKLLLKSLLHASGIAVPRGLGTKNDIRYIVKSVTEHASFGLDKNSVVNSADEARKLIVCKSEQYGGQWLAEEYIEGREFNLAALQSFDGLIFFSPAEILFEDFAPGIPHIIDYNSKWNPDSHSYHHTPRHFVKAHHTLSTLMQNTWHALNLRGYARIDVRMDHNGTYWVIDVNSNPCLSSEAGFMAAARHYGISEHEVIDLLLHNAIQSNSSSKALSFSSKKVSYSA